MTDVRRTAPTWLVKWMTCEVPRSQTRPFSRAQERWAPLADVPGLVCQIGGWDEASPGTACVLAIWRDAEAYDRFMRDRHDALFEATGQAGTYSALQVATGRAMFEMPGAERDAVRALARARVLRVADCEVRPGRVEHFRDVQERVWAPGMASADGMLGGVVSDLGAGRHLVTTGWRDEASHGRYATDAVPALRELAGAADDLLTIRGHRVGLTAGWTVRAG
jgi:quinol monooxygenase YgiN